MQLNLISIADAATIDAGGKLNILGANDFLPLSVFPATCRVVVAFRLALTRQDVGEHELDMRIVDADGNMLSDTPPTQIAVGADPGAFGRLTLPGILVMVPTFPEPGEYSVDVFVNRCHIASAPLHVTDASHGRAYHSSK